MRLKFKRRPGAHPLDLSASEWVCPKCGYPPHPGGLHPIGLAKWCGCRRPNPAKYTGKIHNFLAED